MLLTMLQETTLLVVQVLLILGLAGLLVGWRHWRQRRDRRAGEPLLPPADVPPLPVARMAPVKLAPMAPSPPPAPGVRLVPEELLPGFADTCADWAHQVVAPMQDEAGRSGFSLSDWSAPTDRIELDSGLVLDGLKAPDAPVSCTIAPQARHCA
jgi:hypothetical protein